MNLGLRFSEFRVTFLDHKGCEDRLRIEVRRTPDIGGN